MSSSKTRNEYDIQLLRADFGRLIVKYRGTIRNIVAKYVASGMFDESNTEDLVQAISVSLLQKRAKIQAQYNESTLFRTYVSSIVRNICLKEFHAKKRTPKLVSFVGTEEGPECCGCCLSPCKSKVHAVGRSPCCP